MKAIKPVNPEFLRPSASNKWTKCTMQPILLQSLYEEGKIPLNQEGNQYTDEGTLAHYVWQIENNPHLRGIVFPEDCPLCEDDITVEMLQCAKQCNEYVSQFIDLDKFRHNSETVVPRFYQPEEKCTVDFWGIHVNTLHIFDLKYGANVAVYAENNTQLLIYAASLLKQFPQESIDVVSMHIMQPRKDSFSRWDLATEDFSIWQEAIQEAYDNITGKQENLEFHVSDDTCLKFCPAQTLCPGRAKEVTDAIIAEFKPQSQTISAFEEIPDDLVVWYFKKAKDIKKWLKDIETEAGKRVDAGKIEDLVWDVSYGNRTWIDEEKASKSLRRGLKLTLDDVAPRKVISPAIVDKYIKEKKPSSRMRKVIESMITRKEGKKLIPKENAKHPILPATDGFIKHITEGE